MHPEENRTNVYGRRPHYQWRTADSTPEEDPSKLDEDKDDYDIQDR